MLELLAIDFRGQPCRKSIQLECELVSEILCSRIQGMIEKRGNLYEISYQPIVKGRHQLNIKVSGQHIRGSPFPVAVKSPVEKIGTPISAISGLKEPWSVTFNQRGELVATENGAHISVYSPRGERLRTSGSHGPGQGQLVSPRGVTVDREGNILVADGNNRIQKFTEEGHFLAAAGTKGTGCLQFDHPYDLAFNNSNDKVYVVDANHRVLNSDLSYSSTFGKRGSGKGQFESPYGIACDSTGKVYVADSWNHRIQVFTAEGKFLRMFGKCGTGRGEVNCPLCIAVGGADSIVYVTERNNYRISVFTSKGQFVTSFGKKGKSIGEFNCPWGLAVDDNGVLCVCDFGTGCIQMF